MIELAWSPKEESSQREMVLFKVEGTVRLQAFLIGKAEVPAKPKKVTFKTTFAEGFPAPDYEENLHAVSFAVFVFTV